jgi:hypothetical protein
MPHHAADHKSATLRIVRRILFAVAVVAAAYVAVLVSGEFLDSLDAFSAMPLGSQTAAKHHTATRLDSSLSLAGAQADRSGGDFDYFPDHYRNQATEPAEPIATF